MVIRSIKIWVWGCIIIAQLYGCRYLWAAEYEPINQPIMPKELELKLKTLIGTEIAASLHAIKLPGAKPDSIFGEAIGGEYSWPSFVYALAKYRQLSKSDVLGTHQLSQWIAAYFTKQELANANTFSQLYFMHTLLLMSKGVLTSQSRFFNQFEKSIQDDIIQAADYRRSFDINTMRPVNGRPRNYVAVAALTEAYAIRNGFVKDHSMLKAMLANIISHLKSNEGYLDDDYNGQGRFDRYNFEYLRFAYMAADAANQAEAKKELLPYLKQSAALWWQLFNPESGHSAPYGRSLQNAWDDTFEQTAFYAQFPETSPTTLPQLAAAFINGVNVWCTSEYNFKTHLNRMLDPGRATWSYAGRNRIWSYTFHSLGKMAYAAHIICEALQKQKVQMVNTTPLLGEVNCYFPFNQNQGNQGIWVYRKANKYFVLPIVNGIEAQVYNDYALLPFALPGVGFLVQTPSNNYMPYFKSVGGRYYTISGRAAKVYFNDAEHKLELEFDKLWPVNHKGSPVEASLKIDFTVNTVPHLMLSGHYTILSQLPDSITTVEVAALVNMPNFNQETDLFDNGARLLQLSMTSTLPYATVQHRISKAEKEYNSAFMPNHYKKTLVVENLKSATPGTIIYAIQWIVKRM